MARHFSRMLAPLFRYNLDKGEMVSNFRLGNLIFILRTNYKHFTMVGGTATNGY